MKSRNFLVALAIFAVLALFFGLSRTGFVETGSLLERSRFTGARDGGGKGTKARHERDDTLALRDPRLQAFFLADLYKPPLKDLGQFLAEHHRSAASLIAAYTVCEDQSLLIELMRTHANESSFQAVALWAVDDDLRSEAIERLRKINPENPLPDLLRASGRGRNLSPAEIDDIWERLKGEGLLDLSMLRPSLKLQAWESVTKDPVKAWAYYVNSDAEGAALWKVFSGMENLLKGVNNAEEFEVGEATSRLLALSYGLRGEDRQATESDRLLHGIFEIRLLQMIAADIEYGDQGETVGDRMKQINSLIADSQIAHGQLMKRLKNAEPSLVDDFVRAWKLDGQDQAIRIILNRPHEIERLGK